MPADGDWSGLPRSSLPRSAGQALPRGDTLLPSWGIERWPHGVRTLGVGRGDRKGLGSARLFVGNWLLMRLPSAGKPISSPQPPLQLEINMSTVVSKQEAHKLIDQLPIDATWEDLMREIYVRAAIEKGLEDSRSGRTKDVSEIRAKYGLTE
jgi:hypothetical protein